MVAWNRQSNAPRGTLVSGGNSDSYGHRYTFRQLYKAWGFTAVAILTLALGIGATTAIFSIVERVLLRPLPFPDSKQLVVLSDALANERSAEDGSQGVTAPDIHAYTRDTHSFSSLGGYQKTTYEVSGMGDPVELHAARMTAGVFPALGVKPLLGRFFSEQEDEQNQQVTVLSFSYWKSHLGGDPRVLGMKIELDRKPYVVIGVMPRNFEFPLLPGHLNASQLWVPMSFAGKRTDAWRSELGFQHGWPSPARYDARAGSGRCGTGWRSCATIQAG